MINFTEQELLQCFNFAKAMRGNHNPDIIMERDDWEIFRDDFRGKLGEIAVLKYLRQNIPHALITGTIDFTVTPRGQWDITDLIINNKYINVKAIKQGSNFLLVETLRYDEHGNYTYRNNDGNAVIVDGYILVRVTVEPDVQKNIFEQSFTQFCADGFDPKQRKGVRRQYYAEVLGGISHTDFWQYKAFAPKGIKCVYPNLNAIVNGCDPNALPIRLGGNETPNYILQKDNYVIGSRQLQSLEELFNLHQPILS